METFLKVKSPFCPVENFSSNQHDFVENALNNIFRKRIFSNKRDDFSAQEVIIINPDDQEVDSTPEKPFSTDTLRTPGMTITRSAKH